MVVVIKEAVMARGKVVEVGSEREIDCRSEERSGCCGGSEWEDEREKEKYGEGRVETKEKVREEMGDGRMAA